MIKDDYSPEFSNYIKEVTGKRISELSKEKIDKLYTDFEVGKLAEELYEKVKAEYARFIGDIKKQTVDYIIEAAYEIVWKDNIEQFIENESPCLSDKQYIALLSVKNTLDELYEGWLSNGELHTYDDIEILLEDTAGAILTSVERESEQE